MAPSSSSPPVDELCAELARDPANIELRRVLADAWIAAGDPRGEFVALQLSGDAEAEDRAEAILAANIARWLAPLPVIRERCRFARGFLAGAETPAIGALDRWEWSTVEELVVTAHAHPAPLAERMPLLRALSARGSAALDVAGLAVAGITTEGRASFMAEQRRARAQGLQALVFLNAAVDELPAILAYRGEGPPETRVLVAPNARFPTFHGAGWRLRVYRDQPRADVHFVPGQLADDRAFVPIFEALRNAGAQDVDVRAQPRIGVWFDIRAMGLTPRMGEPGVDLAAFSAVDRR